MYHNKFILLLVALAIPALCFGEGTEEDVIVEETVQDTATVDLKAEKIPLKTDDEVVEREERSVSPDGFSEVERKKIQEGSERHTFQAEVNRMMQIIVHSLYSNKEIFIRELVSNSSDALDKIRFQSLTDPAQLDSNPELEIRIKIDEEARTINITDSGIGMTKEDLVNTLGTIAKSGTKAFSEALEAGTASNLIGQFGVGFYSAYLVADRVVVVSKHNDDEQYVWESDSEDSFTIAKDPRGNTLGRGTSITLFMKDEGELKQEMDEFLQQDVMRGLLEKYSRFINFPIYMWASHEEEHEEIIEDEDDEEELDSDFDDDFEEDLDELDDFDDEEDEEAEPRTRTVTEEVWGWEHINVTKPIWLRSKDEVTEEEYNEFYRAITAGEADPASHIHFSAEGDAQFRAILFLPDRPPYGQFDPTSQQTGVKLYVRRVFITDDFDTVIPKYLSFLRGVVDSDSMPLNISREMLQEHKSLKVMKKKLIRKAISMFQALAQSEDQEKFEQFWENYGMNIKLGVVEDSQNRTRLSKLLRFISSATGKLASFEEYVERMKEGQDQIYYLAGSDVNEMKRSPLLEKLFKNGYEVLFMTDPIDEYAMANLNKYDSKYKITNLGKDGFKLDEGEDDEENEDVEERFESLIDFFKTNYSKQVSRVKISNRLTTSAAAFVAESWGYTAAMQKVIKNQALADKRAAQMYLGGGRNVLEINPKHPIIQFLNEQVNAGKTQEELASTAELVLDVASLASGFDVADTHKFAQNLNTLLLNSLGLEAMEEDVIEDAEDVDGDDNTDGDDMENAGDDEDADEEIILEDAHDHEHTIL